MNNLKQKVAKILFKLLVGRKLIGQTIKYVAALIAASIIALIAKGPGWLQGLVDYLSRESGVEFTEAGLTALVAVIIAESVQWWIDRQNSKGVRKIQEAVDEIRDDWAGEKTVSAVQGIKDRLTAAMREVGELREAIETAKSDD